MVEHSPHFTDDEIEAQRNEHVPKVTEQEVVMRIQIQNPVTPREPLFSPPHGPSMHPAPLPHLV